MRGSAAKEMKVMKLMQRALALVLIYTLFGMVLAVPAMAEEAAPLVNPNLLATVETPRPTVADQPQKASSHEWSKGWKTMTFVGIGLIGAGAVMMTRETSKEAGWHINWRATGAIWMGVGGVLTYFGLKHRK
jgi:hypothetical protein